MKCTCECCQDWSDHRACGCCEGTQAATPVEIFNRPGLDSVDYRIGSHSHFLDSMLARLSSSELEKLQELSTRESDDASIALLDACATVADVLTFYQERIANEGYLRTATQRRSIMELANLAGYRLRPGVAASVHLAFTVDESNDGETLVPEGTAAQSIPGPDELPQTFETAEDIKARYQWNNLQPRLSQPQTWDSIFPDPELFPQGRDKVYLQGVNTQLKVNDPLLIQQGNATPEFRRVYQLVTDADADRTLVYLSPPPAAETSTDIPVGLVDGNQLIAALAQAHSVQPRNALRLNRTLRAEFPDQSQSGYTALKSFVPRLRRTLAAAAANAAVIQSSDLKVFALRQQASVFGHNAPARTRLNSNDEVELVGGHGNWPVFEANPGSPSGPVIFSVANPTDVADDFPSFLFHESESVIHLDAAYDGIQPGSWLVIETGQSNLSQDRRLVVQAQTVAVGATRNRYGISGPTTRIDLGDSNRWLEFTEQDATETVLKSVDIAGDFEAIRMTRVYAEGESLELAEEPVEQSICTLEGEDLEIELDGFYDGLESGRWVIVAGERELQGTSKVLAAELAMLSSVEHRHNESLPGDRLHTAIRFAEPLKYCFKRDSVKIYGNVAKATHGETQEEILGNGDARQAFQNFELKQKPVTFTAAPNPAGVVSSLEVRVNDLRWQETDCLVALAAEDRGFSTKTDAEDNTAIIFGNGHKGLRLPTGVANVRAKYRAGIGRPGNVKAEQVSLLKTKPLGVQQVINPLRASGGADREHMDQARDNIPLALKALDRLVSVQDYEDFSKVFAGIGKARATELSDGRRQLVHVTIAGADDIPIDETSDLYRNLYKALREFGDPQQPIKLAVRERLMLFLQAGISIDPDYEWEAVSSKLRQTVLDAFSFAAGRLGQDVYLSEVLSVMQAVPGVIYVDVDQFDGIPEKITDWDGQRRLLTPMEINQIANGSFVMPVINQEEFQPEASQPEITGGFESMVVVVGERRPQQRIRVNLAAVDAGGNLNPAQIAFFDPEVPATLILNQIQGERDDTSK